MTTLERIGVGLDSLVSDSFEKGRRQNIRNDDVSKATKLAAIKLAYL